MLAAVSSSRGARSSRAQRFNLLLLDEGEHYLNDFSGECTLGDLRALAPASPGSADSDRGRTGGTVVLGTQQPPVSLPQRGRLRLCTASLLFEPDDTRLPIVKLPFRSTLRLSVVEVSHQQQQQHQQRRLPRGRDARPRSGTSPTSVVEVVLDALVLAKIGGANHPYVFREANDAISHKTPSFCLLSGNQSPTGKPCFVFRFGLSYTSPDSVVGLMQRLHVLVRAIHSETIPSYPSLAGMDATAEPETQLERLVVSLHSQIRFDRGRLADVIHETVALEQLNAMHVTPLTTNLGVLAVTNQNLYFQPFSNEQIGAEPVSRWELGRIVRVARRRYVLRDVGLEVFLEKPKATGFQAPTAAGPSANTSRALWTANSVFFAVKSSVERDALEAALLSQPGVHAQQFDDVTSVAADWVAGKLSNFDYLMYLNAAAGRTFNDLTQYPVFPWVLADYESASIEESLSSSGENSDETFRDFSKPIGALNPERLRHLKERFAHMEEAKDPDNPPFLYGTHYSAPGYVLFYLVRRFPDFVLRLQNGRFDAPGRMFHNVGETWRGVLNNQADVKELIPEFYMLASDIDDGVSDADAVEFLCNRQHLDLGVKPDTNERLHDVILPRWAKGSAVEFVKTMRRALESDYVSSRLHNWIDLIFGHKQRGPSSVAADNVFYHITYEGAVDIDRIAREDSHRARALVQQIKEFGQTPRQLFTTPHPSRQMKGWVGQLESSSSFDEIKPDTTSSVTHPREPVAKSEQVQYSAPRTGGALTGSDLIAELGDIDETPGSPPEPRGAAALLQRISEPQAPVGPSAAVRTQGVAPPSTTNRFASFFANAKAKVETVLEDLTAPQPGMRQPELPGSGEPVATRERVESPRAEPSGEPLAVTALDPAVPSPPTSQGLALSVAATADTAGMNARASTAAALARADWSGVEKIAPAFSAPPCGDQITDLCLVQSPTDAQPQIVSVGHSGMLRIFSVSDKRQVRRVEVCEMALSSLCVSPDSHDAVISSWDNNLYVVSLFDSQGVCDVLQDAHTDAVSCVALNATGTLVISGGWDGVARLWAMDASARLRFGADARAGRPQVEYERLGSSPGDEVWCCALDPTPATSLAVVGTRDGTVSFLSIPEERVVHSHPRLHNLGGASGTTSVAFSPNGTRIVTAGADATVRVISIVNAGESSGVFPILWSLPVPSDKSGGLHCAVTDGTRILAAGSGGELRVWETSSKGSGSAPELAKVRCMGPADGGVGSIAIAQPNADIVVCAAFGSSGLIRVFEKR